MTADVISAGEAWEAIERLGIDIYHNATTGNWCANVEKPKYQWAFGRSAREAVGNLLSRIGEAANKAEAANV